MHYVRSCKSPCELCAWLTLFLAALVAWDVAPEYNFMIGVFGLIAVRADDARLVSYMALTVPLLVIADISYFFLADLSGFSFWICFVMFFIKIMWTYFSARFMLELDGTYLAFFDCFRRTAHYWHSQKHEILESVHFAVDSRNANPSVPQA
uniref:Uncharacterized protein n=1 Tax=Heterosigma akashiwo TaxID=2829 RepID=A0A6V1MKM0_HETAK|mmetsp:Transcript_29703/g.43826  ORF Transcript_29703/g.43826 Transcript_29703/m.43826 type:complete len:151 (-) Transcript_29703:270-722(-)